MSVAADDSPTHGDALMKCPSCNAPVNPSASVCQNCGQKLAEATPKRTMMGLPSVGRDSNEPKSSDPTKESSRSTLFGIPAATKKDGLSESTAPSMGSNTDDSDGDASTRVVSDLDLGAALEQHEQQNQNSEGGRSKHATAFGLPSAKSNSGDGGQDVASAWGLAEESSEGESSATQVAGAALADAIFESKHGAGGFSKTTNDDSGPIHGTLMGMSRDEIDEDSTREVDREQLEQVRKMHAAAEEAKRKRLAEEAKAAEPEPESPFEEDEDTTQALGPDELAKFEERIQTDRRKQLLNKLRSKSKPADDSPSDTAKGIPSAPTQQQQAQQQQQSRPQTGPRFSIPSPGQRKAQAEPEEIAVEPVEEPQRERDPSFGGRKTSFPIPSSASDDPEPTQTPQRDLSDDELELALGDTGVVSGEAAAQSMSGDSGEGIHEFGDNDTPAPPDSGIQAFVESSEADDEPIFPIDQQSGHGTGQQFDLSNDVEPVNPMAQGPPSESSQPMIDSFGETPASGSQVPSAQPAQQQQGYGQQQSYGQQQPAQQQQMTPQPTGQQQPVAQSEDPTRKLVGTVQVIFGVLGALFLVGAGGYGFVSGPAEEMVGQIAMGAPAAVGLLTLIVAFLPLSGGAKSGGFFTMTALAGGALAAGVMFSAPMAVMLLVLGGLLLVLCAGAFPLVLKVVQ